MASTPSHFVFFPLMAQGHLIPAFDFAKLLAQRRATVTIFTTPKNAARFRHLLTQSNLQIHLLLLDFQILESSGLPHGCENMDQLPSFHLAYFFMIWLAALQPQVEQLMRKLTPPPCCIVADLHLPWTGEIARDFNIPWIGFHTGSGFYKLICEKKNEKPTDDFFKQVEETRRAAYGMVINSFEEMEGAYVEEYRNLTGRKIWCVGPVSLCNKEFNEMAERGRENDTVSENWLPWLDLQPPASVIYVCLGSLCNLPAAELIELGMGLEASGKPFLWLLRAGDEFEEVNQWISEVGFEEKIKGRGFLVQGWAPQLLILRHRSIGGFLTHCGWNSVLEGICAGLPMVTLPLFGDQFCNEELVVEELKIGVKSGKEEGRGVRREKVVEAVEMVMGGGDDGGERRKRARELSEMAKNAMKDGGSSQMNIAMLIEDIEDMKK